MKYKNLINYIVASMTLVAIAGCQPKIKYETIQAKAPFEIPEIRIPIYPERDFNIIDYGAVPSATMVCTDAIAAAIADCHSCGGGRVVIPTREWITGPIHFKSNVNLYLSEGAVLRFTDNPEDYLPAVATSWEGMECYYYSPLVYAYECENIAITGTGKLYTHMDLWSK